MDRGGRWNRCALNGQTSLPDKCSSSMILTTLTSGWLGGFQGLRSAVCGLQRERGEEKSGSLRYHTAPYPRFIPAGPVPVQDLGITPQAVDRRGKAKALPNGT